MAQLTCRGCGKVLLVPPQEHGKLITCPACGQIQLAPGDRPGDHPAVIDDRVDMDVPAVSSRPMPRRDHKPSRTWVYATAGSIVLITAAVVAMLLTRPEPVDPQVRWERENQATLLRMKSEAEALAIEGRLAEAHAKYRELQSFVGNRKIKDPDMWLLLDRARADQDRVYILMLRQQELARQRTGQAEEDSPATAVAQDNPPDEIPAPAVAEAVPAETQPAIPAPMEESAPSVENPANAPEQIAEAAPANPQVPVPPRKRPLAVVSYAAPPIIGDEEIGMAIKAATDYLIAQYNKDGDLIGADQMNQIDQGGTHALGVYALLAVGQATKDPRLNIQGAFMKQLLEKLKRHPMEGTPGSLVSPVVYARSLRAAALAVYNRPEDQKTLREDVKWLIEAAKDGAYTYDDKLSRPAGARLPATALPEDLHVDADPAPKGRPLIGGPDAKIYAHDGEVPGVPRAPPPPTGPLSPSRPRPTTPFPVQPRTTRPPPGYETEFPWDNSNSQYGLLGVWSGAEAGIEVPLKYWQAVEKHWTNTQLPDGQWYYSKADTSPRYSMTCAGLASLFVTHDYLVSAQSGRPAKDPYPVALMRGLRWLETGENALDISGPNTHFIGYNLYGLERIALASGMKYFGRHDWYPVLARRIIDMQHPNGAFGRVPDAAKGIDSSLQFIDTAYVMLFLARGRHPILMNKLQFDGFSNNHPRDLANLARFATRELERPVNWQMVNLHRDPADWMDSPILFIASHTAPRMTDADFARLRTFVQHGGMLFTQADWGGEAFSQWVAETLAKEIAPDYELKDLATDHELYTLHYQIKLPRPRLRAVSNGVRLLLVHSPTDLTMAWQQRAEKTKRPHYELGVNLFVYAAGKADLRNRLNSPVVPIPPNPPSATYKLARLRHDGNWNPEPFAWIRFARYLQWETGMTLSIHPTHIQNLDPKIYQMAHLTGTEALSLTNEQTLALKQYVEAGGTLVLDAAGGAGAFAESAEQFLSRVFPNEKGEALPPNHPLLTESADGFEAVPQQGILRPYAAAKLGGGSRVKLYTPGKGLILYSPIDLAGALVGTDTYLIHGHSPAYVHPLMKNLTLYTLDRQQ